MYRFSRLLGAAAALAVTVTPALVAQSGTITGVVTDSLRPLGHATIEIFGIKGSRTTDATGAFQFDSLKSGPYWLRVRRIGYHPITFTVSLVSGTTRNLDIRMEQAAYQLSDLEVQGGMTDYRYNDFKWRSRTAWGKFYTRDDITRLRPVDVIDLAQRGLPGMSRWDLEQINWFPPGTGPRTDGQFGFARNRWSSPSRSRSEGCPPAISRNGATPWPGWSLRDFQVEEVEAIEIYRSRHLPIEFQGGTAGCGLVVVWLK